MKKNSQFLKFLLFSFVFFGIVSCAEVKQNKKDPPKKFPVYVLKPINTELKREYVCQVIGIKNIELSSRVEGYLDKIYVDEGKEVVEGQLIFSIRNDKYKADLSKAKANLKNAIAQTKSSELEVEQTKLLVDKGVVSKLELELAKAKLRANQAKIEEAQSEQENAELLVSMTQVKAPFSGNIDRIPLKVGSTIELDDVFTSLTDNSNVYCYFNLSEIEYLAYVAAKKKGDEADLVELRMADGNLHPHKGKIETMESVFDGSTGTIAFRARFPNPEKILKHNSSGKVILTSKLDNALLVPQRATYEIQDRNYVYVVDKDNKVSPRYFTPAYRIDEWFVVSKGLVEGEKIVVEGIQDLKDGMLIEPVIKEVKSEVGK